MPLTVGLTGGIASGKSTVCSISAELGANIIDADSIAKAVCQPGMPAYQQIVAYFGKSVLNEDGQLNRPVLRQRIFNDANERQMLEAIIHPEVRQQLTEQLAKSRATITIAAVPLLIEANMQTMFDRVLLVTTQLTTQLQRLMSREGMSETLAKQMIAAQIDDQQRLHYADDIIENNGDMHSLTIQIKKLMQTYQQLAADSP